MFEKQLIGAKRCKIQILLGKLFGLSHKQNEHILTLTFWSGLCEKKNSFFWRINPTSNISSFGSFYC